MGRSPFPTPAVFLGCLYLVAGFFLPSFGAVPGPTLTGVPAVVDFSRYDIEHMEDRLKASTVSDRLARAEIDFDYMRTAGTQGAMFQCSYGTTGFDAYGHPDSGDDDCFRVWADQAVQHGIYVGAYHFFHPYESSDQQLHRFLDRVKDICGGEPKIFAGKPILLGFDAGRESIPFSALMPKVAAFAQAIHDQTGVWPLFYPENNLKEPDYYTGLNCLTAAEQAQLGHCWLWASNYTRPPVYDDSETKSYYWLWKGWTFWQYYASEDWYGPSCVYKAGQAFPIPPPGSALPLDCNYYADSREKLAAFWQKNGWIVVPAAKAAAVTAR